MLITITTTHRPATDLGFLLAKHPERHQAFALAFGTAHVLYPEAGEGRCTAAMVLDLDPIALVRGRRQAGETGLLAQYVNDRPYAASSLASVALARVFASAMAGRSVGRPELAQTPIPLELRVVPVACRGGRELAERLFAPLGHAVEARSADDGGRYWDLRLAGTMRLCDALSHLYVLIPVLDDDKHYWVGEDEVDKLLARGADWLPRHPARELIARRYLKHAPRLTRLALARLAELDDTAAGEADTQKEAETEERAGAGEGVPRLNDLRHQRVAALLAEAGGPRVLDLGCGSGRLIQRLMKNRQFERIVGVDASVAALEMARSRLGLDRLPEKDRTRVELLHGGLTCADARLVGFDAAAVVEAIEHIDPPRLDAFTEALFGRTRPRLVVLTTPNADYNPLLPIPPGRRYRDGDHRFEFSRAAFAAWAEDAAGRFGYTVRIEGIGEPDPALGPPTQMAIFRWT